MKALLFLLIPLCVSAQTDRRWTLQPDSTVVVHYQDVKRWATNRLAQNYATRNAVLEITTLSSQNAGLRRIADTERQSKEAMRAAWEAKQSPSPWRPSASDTKPQANTTPSTPPPPAVVPLTTDHTTTHHTRPDPEPQSPGSLRFCLSPALSHRLRYFHRSTTPLRPPQPKFRAYFLHHPPPPPPPTRSPPSPPNHPTRTPHPRTRITAAPYSHTTCRFSRHNPDDLHRPTSFRPATPPVPISPPPLFHSQEPLSCRTHPPIPKGTLLMCQIQPHAQPKPNTRHCWGNPKPTTPRLAIGPGSRIQYPG